MPCTSDRSNSARHAGTASCSARTWPSRSSLAQVTETRGNDRWRLARDPQRPRSRALLSPGRRGLRRGSDCRGLRFLRGLSDHPGQRDHGDDRAPLPFDGGARVRPDGGRAGLHRRRDRRLVGRREGHDGHVGTWAQPDAREPGLCSHDRDSPRARGHPEGGPQHRSGDATSSGGCDAGPLGCQRRL